MVIWLVTLLSLISLHFLLQHEPQSKNYESILEFKKMLERLVQSKNYSEKKCVSLEFKNCWNAWYSQKNYNVSLEFRKCWNAWYSQKNYSQKKYVSLEFQKMLERLVQSKNVGTLGTVKKLQSKK